MNGLNKLKKSWIDTIDNAIKKKHKHLMKDIAIQLHDNGLYINDDDGIPIDINEIDDINELIDLLTYLKEYIMKYKKGEFE